MDKKPLYIERKPETLDICGSCDAEESMDKFLKSVSPTISLISSELSDKYIEQILGHNGLYQYMKSETVSRSKHRNSNENRGEPKEDEEVFFNVKIISLITNKYKSFPVRYIPNINKQLDLQRDANFKTYENVNLAKNDKHITNFSEFLSQLYNEDTNNGIFVSPFNTFNHPIMYLVTLTVDDDVSTINRLMKENKLNRKKHLYNLNDGDEGKTATITDEFGDETIPNFINMENDDDSIICFQILSDQDTNQEKIKELQSTIKKTFYYSCLILNLESINATTTELIKSIIIPFMEKKISYWDDVYIQPRKSLTNRFFKFMKRQDDSSSNNSGNNGKSRSNNVGGIFNHDSLEMSLRRLADWSFILKDYKYSSQVYETLLKEINSHDNNNNRSKYYWNYLTSVQEYLMFSNLFLISNSEFNKKFPNMNIIIDQINYNYLFRCNLNSNYLKFIVEISELINFKNSEFEKTNRADQNNNNSKTTINLESNNSNSNVKNNFNLNYSINYYLQLLHDLKNLNYFFKYLIMERISYYYSNFGGQMNLLNFGVDGSLNNNDNESSTDCFKVFGESTSDEKIMNPYKLNKHKDLSRTGIARTRKQKFYELLSLNELKDMPEDTEDGLKATVDCKAKSLLEYYKNNEWLLRENGLLGKNVIKLTHNNKP